MIFLLICLGAAGNTTDTFTDIDQRDLAFFKALNDVQVVCTREDRSRQ